MASAEATVLKSAPAMICASSSRAGMTSKGRKRQPAVCASAWRPREMASERFAALVTRSSHGAASARAAVCQKR
eukprot:16451205-Heterocapsa_arctica.AAC.1